MRRALTDQLRTKSRRRRAALAPSRDVTCTPRNDLLPQLQLVDRSIDGLLPPARNARPADPAHVREIANAITAFGFCAPVLIDQDGRVLDGWARVEAARQSGLKRLPCVLAGHLTAAERRLLRLAINRLGEKGRWDLGELKLELNDLILEGMPLEVSGFSEIEIDQITMDEEPDAAEDGPLEPDPALEAIAQPGDIFAVGRHRIVCGDARDPALLARLMASAEARLVLTDVPYNVPIKGHVSGQNHREFAMASGEMSSDEFLAFNQAWIEQAGRHLVEGGVIGTFIDWRGYPAVHAAATAVGLTPLNLVVWSKTNAGMGSLYRSAHELLPLFKKGKAAHVNNVELGRHGRWRSNVWTYPGASSIGSDAQQGLRLHPTVKPVAMIGDALLDLTRRGDIVLDPFLGSGSTVIAAEKSDRACYGVEVDPLYVDVVLRRVEAVVGSKAVRVDA